MVLFSTFLFLLAVSLFALHFPSNKGGEGFLIPENPNEGGGDVSPLLTNRATEKTPDLLDKVASIEGIVNYIHSFNVMDRGEMELVLLDILEHIEILNKRRKTIAGRHNEENAPRDLTTEESNQLERLHSLKEFMAQSIEKKYFSSSYSLMRYPLYRKHVCSFGKYFENMSEIPKSLAFSRVFYDVYSWRGLVKAVFPLAKTAGIVQDLHIEDAFQNRVDTIVSSAKEILRLLVKASSFTISTSRGSLFNAWSSLFKRFYEFFNDIGLIFCSFWSSISKMSVRRLPLTDSKYATKLEETTTQLFRVGKEAHRTTAGLDLDTMQPGTFLEININEIESQLGAHARVFDGFISREPSEDHIAYERATNTILNTIREMNEDVKLLLPPNFPGEQTYNSVSEGLDQTILKSLKFTRIIDTVLNEKSVLFPLLMAFQKHKKVSGFLPFFIRYSDPSVDSDFLEIFDIDRKSKPYNVQVFNADLIALPSTVWKYPYSVLFSMLDPTLSLNVVLSAGSALLSTMKKQHRTLQNQENMDALISRNMVSVQMHSKKKLEQMVPVLKANIDPRNPSLLEEGYLSLNPRRVIESIYSRDGPDNKIARSLLDRMFGDDQSFAILCHLNYLRMRMYSFNEYHFEPMHSDFHEDRYVDNETIKDISGINILENIFKFSKSLSHFTALGGIVLYFRLKNMVADVLANRNR